jgi:hypothetical protein
MVGVTVNNVTVSEYSIVSLGKLSKSIQIFE